MARLDKVRRQVHNVVNEALHRRPVVDGHRARRPRATRQTSEVVGELQKSTHTTIHGCLVAFVKALCYTQRHKHGSVTTTAGGETHPGLVPLVAEKAVHAARNTIVIHTSTLKPVSPAPLVVLAVAFHIRGFIGVQGLVRSVAHKPDVVVAFRHRGTRDVYGRIRVLRGVATLLATLLIHNLMSFDHGFDQALTLIRRNSRIQLMLLPMCCTFSIFVCSLHLRASKQA